MVSNSRTKNSSDEWITPQKVFDKIEQFLGVKFTLDPSASDENHKCEKYFTKKENGLIQSWQNEIVFINPEYKNKGEWIEKAILEVELAHINRTNIKIVFILPITGLETALFHEQIWPHANEIYFMKKRIQFEKPIGEDKKRNNLGSMLVVFRRYNFSGPTVSLWEWDV